MKTKRLPSVVTLTFLCFLLAGLSTLSVRAQYCGGSGPSVCTPQSGLTVEGFYPSDTALPCITDGSPTSQVVSFFAPSTVQGYTLKDVQITSLTNLPCGLCWASNSSTNTINGNSAGCIKVTGTSNEAAGEYNILVYATATVTFLGIPINIGPLNIDSALGLSYYVRVHENGQTCAPVDTNSKGGTASTPGACAKPTFTKKIANCAVTETAVGTYYGYAWSNGTFGSSITVAPTVTTKYHVTVYDNCASATAVVSVAPIAAETVTISVTTGATSVKLKAVATASTYKWSTGATTATITVKALGTYTVTATKTATGCAATASYNVTTLAPVRNPVADKTDDGITTATETPATLSGTNLEASVYPNPYASVFHVKITSSSTQNININVYDINGRLIEQKLNVTYTNDVMLGDNYANGTYVIQVKQGETTKELKVVKTE